MRQRIVPVLALAGAILGVALCLAPTARARAAPPESRAGQEASGEKTFVGKCLLEINGKKYLNGRCPIRTGDGGDFTVGAAAGKPLTYFATVSMTGKGVAEGYWNEDKGANHAQTPLGTLNFNHGCWQNQGAKVCAWK